MKMTHNDIPIARDRLDVSFHLSIDASAASGAMLTEMHGLYQIPVDVI